MSDTDDRDPKQPQPPPPSLKGRILKHVGRALEIGNDAADILVHVQRVTPLGVASLGLRVVDSVRSHFGKTPREFFVSGPWEPLETRGYDEYLYEVCASRVKSELVEGLDDEHQQAVITKVADIPFGWIMSGASRRSRLRDREDSERSGGPWVPAGTDHKQAIQTLGRLVWDHVGSSRCVLTGDKDGSPVFESEADMELFPSGLADEMLGRANRFLEKGLHRSILLLGEPGTGKTCMMRYMAARTRGFSLRIAINDLKTLARRDLMASLAMLAPDTLIVDDFDRLEKSDTLLSELEAINRQVKLFMVSCNRVDKIDDAVLRPGRFDEMHIIEELDAGVIDQLVGDIDLTTKKILKQLPIASVVEFVRRRDALGLDEAKSELRELAERAHKVELFRKRRERGGRRRIRSQRTPAQIARLRRQQATWKARAVQDLQHELKDTLPEKLSKAREQARLAEVRAQEAEKRAAMAATVLRKRAAKKAAATRARRKKLKEEARKQAAADRKQADEEAVTEQLQREAEPKQRAEAPQPDIAPPPPRPADGAAVRRKTQEMRYRRRRRERD